MTCCYRTPCSGVQILKQELEKRVKKPEVMAVDFEHVFVIFWFLNFFCSRPLLQSCTVTKKKGGCIVNKCDLQCFYHSSSK